MLACCYINSYQLVLSFLCGRTRWRWGLHTLVKCTGTGVCHWIKIKRQKGEHCRFNSNYAQCYEDSRWNTNKRYLTTSMASSGPLPARASDSSSTRIRYGPHLGWRRNGLELIEPLPHPIRKVGDAWQILIFRRFLMVTLSRCIHENICQSSKTRVKCIVAFNIEL